MNKRTKLKQFDKKTAQRIHERDTYCIFCKANYRMDKTSDLLPIIDVMHFIPKSDGGLGIEQNGALGCRFHHHMLDNGNIGARTEMLEYFETYLRSKYTDWDKEALRYKKYSF